jgi:hypothetical protein
VLEIGEEAFGSLSSGSSNSSIKLPKNLKKIGDSAFYNCKNLGGAITIPAGVTEILSYTFCNTNITEVTIPDSVAMIGENTFSFCTELTTVKLPSHPIQYLHTGGYRYGSEGGNNDAFKGCGKLSLATRKAIQDSGYTGEF